MTSVTISTSSHASRDVLRMTLHIHGSSALRGQKEKLGQSFLHSSPFLPFPWIVFLSPAYLTSLVKLETQPAKHPPKDIIGLSHIPLTAVQCFLQDVWCDW